MFDLVFPLEATILFCLKIPTNSPVSAKNERKITTGTKTFVVGAEDESLMPIHEDDDSQN